MSIPERTIEQLINWMDRFICDPQKSEYFLFHCKKFVDPKNLQATPIPCPNCYGCGGTLKNPLRVIGDISGIGVMYLKCDECGFAFPEIIGMSLDVFQSVISEGRVHELFDQLIYDDLWVVENDLPWLKLTEKIIKQYMESGRLEE